MNKMWPGAGGWWLVASGEWRVASGRWWILLMLCVFTACQQEEDPGSFNTPVAIVSEDETAPAVKAVIGDSSDATSIPTIELTATPIPSPTATSTPTATPEPPKEIRICVGQEPISLYLYGQDPSLATTAVHHALYENLTTTLGYDYQPQGLEKLPSLTEGEATINPVEVNRGDRVVTLGGNATELIEGVSVINAAGEIVAFDGRPIMMSQMVVEFTLKPLVWADGTPVTAADSVYSFQLDADPITPGSKFKIERTTSYEAVNDLTVRWTGLPGFNDPEYITNAWPPLPQHQLADFTATELLTAEESARHPLSSGPFMVQDWVLGDHMTLVANPHYYRQAEGLPHIDRITITFHPDGDALTAVCDIITQDALTVEQASSLSDGALIPYFQSSGVFEHIAFGINSYEDYGDGHEDGRPDWFQAAEVRRAIATCIDRQRMVAELTFGKGALIPAYIPTDHPLFPEDALTFTYDPIAANAQLDALGYVDVDGDGLRQDVSSGLPFSITLGTDNSSPLRPQIIRIVQENLRDCGIDVSLFELPIAEWFADGTVGPLFGREFDLGEFAWRVGARPSCHLWLTENISGPEFLGFGGWRGVNVTGWSNEAYDRACTTALNTLPGAEGYRESHQEAVRIFMTELPAIPLFAHAKAALATPLILNFHLDPSQPSELWNIAELDLEVTN